MSECECDLVISYGCTVSCCLFICLFVCLDLCLTVTTGLLVRSPKPWKKSLTRELPWHNGNSELLFFRMHFGSKEYNIILSFKISYGVSNHYYYTKWFRISVQNSCIWAQNVVTAFEMIFAWLWIYTISMIQAICIVSICKCDGIYTCI